MAKKIRGVWALNFVCIFIFLAFILGQQKEQEKAQVDGKILDMEKKPITQAEVQLNHVEAELNYTSKSNKEGEFTFRMLSPGKYVLAVLKEGYKSYSMELELQPGSHQGFEIILAKELSSEQKTQQEAYALFQKGMELSKEKKIDEAIEAFRKSVKLKDDFAEAYINLGILLFQEAKDEEAEKVLVKALELKPKEPRTKEILGNIYFDKAKALLLDDKIDQALEKLKTSYSYNPSYSYTYYLLGYAYYKKGMREEAIKYFEAFLQMEPDAPQAPRVKEILESLKK